MATKQEQKFYQEQLDYVTGIKDQRLADKETSAETRSFARRNTSFASTMTDNLDYYTDAGIDGDAVDAVIGLLEEWAATLSPTATQWWNQEDVNKVLTFLNAAVMNDLVTDETDILAIKEASDVLAKGGTGGSRKPREDAPTLPDRPPRVWIMANGNKVSNQKGNTTSSFGNIKGKAVKWVTDNVGAPSEAEITGIEEAIATVLSNDASTASFGGLTFEARGE